MSRRITRGQLETLKIMYAVRPQMIEVMKAKRKAKRVMENIDGKKNSYVSLTLADS